MSDNRVLPPWARTALGFYRDPKVLALDWPAKCLFHASILWAREQRTDGLVPFEVLPAVKPPDMDLGLAERCAAEIVAAGLWELADDGSGWLIVRFKRWQETTAKATAAAARQRASRAARNGST